MTTITYEVQETMDKKNRIKWNTIKHYDGTLSTIGNYDSMGEAMCMCYTNFLNKHQPKHHEHEFQFVCESKLLN